MARRGPLPMFFSVVGLSLALGVIGCGGSTPRDIRYGTDAESDFDAPPEPILVDGGDAGDVAPADASDASDVADASEAGSDATDAGADSGDTATDGTGN